MKVVILGQYPLNPEKIRGGVETCIIGLANELKKYPDIELHILTLEIMQKDITKTVDNATIHYLASPPLPRFITKNTIDKNKTIKKIKELKPDIVHAHMYDSGYYALKSGFPSLITIHGIAMDEYDIKIQSGLLEMIRRMVYLPIEQYVFKRAKVLTVLSPYTKKKIELFCNGEIHIIPNGINKEWFNIQNKEIDGRILFVGRIFPVKRIEYLLQAVKRIRYHRKNVELHIAGDFNEKKVYFNLLRKFTDKNELSKNVKFMGALHGNNLRNEYAECSIFVLASHIEAFPIVLLEAMASGKPIIASNVGSIPYIIKDGENGFLFEYGDVDDLANKITKLLNDRELRLKMGNNGKKIAKGFPSWEEIAQKYYKLYKTVSQ
ncbi:glycosyltransferase family 4 protein [Candidatus Parcubacteria bacterium]|nr:glycosyltransferase family 4 protein [Candidatus Parcubacteria bacterium]